MITGKTRRVFIGRDRQMIPKWNFDLFNQKIVYRDGKKLGGLPLTEIDKWFPNKILMSFYS